MKTPEEIINKWFREINIPDGVGLIIHKDNIVHLFKEIANLSSNEPSDLIETWTLRMNKARKESENTTNPLTKKATMATFMTLRDCIKDFKNQPTPEGQRIVKAGNKALAEIKKYPEGVSLKGLKAPDPVRFSSKTQYEKADEESSEEVTHYFRYGEYIDGKFQIDKTLCGLSDWETKKCCNSLVEVDCKKCLELAEKHKGNTDIVIHD